MRLDEFSSPSDIDGTLSTTEIARFLLFGFDIALDPPVIIVPESPERDIPYSGAISMEQSVASSGFSRESGVINMPYTENAEFSGLPILNVPYRSN